MLASISAMPSFSSVMEYIMTPPPKKTPLRPALRRTGFFDKVGNVNPLLCRAPRPCMPTDALAPYLYFGFAVSGDILKRCGPSPTVLDGVRALKARSGIARLGMRYGGADSDIPVRALWCVLPSGAVPVLVLCTATSAQYKERPSQEQVDRLAALIGHPPRWWVDFAVFEVEAKERVLVERSFYTHCLHLCSTCAYEGTPNSSAQIAQTQPRPEQKSKSNYI